MRKFSVNSNWKHPIHKYWVCCVHLDLGVDIDTQLIKTRKINSNKFIKQLLTTFRLKKSENSFDKLREKKNRNSLSRR